MKFKRIEDVLKFLKENGYWNSVYQHKDALEIALTPDNIDDIFGMIVRGTGLPLIYESGCGTGLTTTQICGYLSGRGIERYKLVGHDVQENLVGCARSRFSGNENVTVYRSLFKSIRGWAMMDIPSNARQGLYKGSWILLD